ncbi:uncharacterized protein LOC118765760 [Octopus sinensis]|uniref:Uncharacterized protein LOC118765760 n=1 Tax=Octopus sinensis TaxID=2607531 RepID=A0A7E6F8F1_9MOLL|nr:uncharacterized protein LOC118765760 [Octopus sinensis]
MNTIALPIFLLFLLYDNGVPVFSKNPNKICPEILPHMKPRHKHIARFSNISITKECAKLCLYRSVCNSFAFNQKKEICEIYFAVRHNLREIDHYVFSFIKTWDPRLAGSCFNHSCERNEMCLPETNAYYCLQLDINCGLPRQENSAVISYQSTNTVKYSCLSNQTERMIHSFCKLTGIWSKPTTSCGFSCRHPYLVNLTISNGAYVDSYWNYECGKMNTTCHMKGIWSKTSRNDLNISCTTKEDAGQGFKTTNVSYRCARVRSGLVPVYDNLLMCLRSEYIKDCNVICNIPNGKNLKYSTVRRCKRFYICHQLKSNYRIRKLVFCQPNIEMENGTISFEGVMKMVCEILDQLTLETIRNNSGALLPGISAGFSDSISTAVTESTTNIAGERSKDYADNQAFNDLT